jgi:hypothetical protein
LLVFRHRRRRLGSIDFLLIRGVVVVARGVATCLVVSLLIVASLILRRWRRRLILTVLLRFGGLRRVGLVRWGRRWRCIRRRTIIVGGRRAVDRRVVCIGRIARIVLDA